jgi:hypothetical protein
MRTDFSTALVAALFVLAADPTSPQAPVPVGGEFLVNTFTPGHQTYSTVGVDADGDFVVVWRSSDGDAFGIFARRFNASGAAQGGELQINAYTTGDQAQPVVDMSAAGDFVVSWQSFGQDGDQEGIFTRRFSSGGTAVTAELMVNTITANIQRLPSVAIEGNGDFVVVWEANFQDGASFGVFARRFSSAGIAQGGEFRTNSYTPNSQRLAAVDLDADGDFVVTWNSSAQDGNAYGVFAQRFSSAGGPLGPEFQVNSTFTSQQIFPRVGLDSDGDFVVVWLSDDGGSYGVFGRRFSSSGTPLGAEFPINSYTPTDQSTASVALEGDGDFAVSWKDNGQDGSGYGVFVKRFKSSGVPQNLDLRVNTTTSDDQTLPGVGVDADGDFVVTWTGVQGPFTDIFAQRFDVPLTIDVDGDGQYLPLTDGLLLLRFGFGFSGNTLVAGAVGPGCTRCDVPSITAYLQGLV